MRLNGVMSKGDRFKDSTHETKCADFVYRQVFQLKIELKSKCVSNNNVSLDFCSACVKLPCFAITFYPLTLS